MTKFDIEHSHAETFVENNDQYLFLSKASYNSYDKKWYSSGEFQIINDEDIRNIEKDIKGDYAKFYRLNEKNAPIGLDINYKEFFSSKNRSYYFSVIPNQFNFIETEKDFVDGEILGTYPTEPDEIMIHSYLAEYMMQAGVMLYMDTVNPYKEEYYMPTSYEDLLKPNRYLKLGSEKVRISGILMDDTKKFEQLKNILADERLMQSNTLFLGVLSSNAMYEEFNVRILKRAMDIYVTKNFIQNLSLKKNIELDGNDYIGMVNIDGKDDYLGNQYRYLNEKIAIYNGEKYVTINQLNKNEIIIDESFLDHISSSNYSKLKEQYIKKQKELYQKIVAENKELENLNKKILEEYLTKVEAGMSVSEPVLHQLKEVVEKSDEEYSEEFTRNYLKEHALIGKTVTLKFITNDTEKTETFENIKIVGIHFSDENLYMASNIANHLMKENSYPYGIIVKNNNLDEVEEMLRTFPQNNSRYLSFTPYTNTIRIVRSMLENMSTIAFIASIIFGLFAFILLTNFIVNSIYYNKKTIGILRGLGARKIDVFKIFANESLIIGGIALILSIIFLYVGVDVANQYISSHLFFYIAFIKFSFENLLLMIGSVLAIIMVTSLFTVKKIAKMKPIDAILNK